ncbi:hypothetical protein [Desulfosporosinus sp. OT]|uniref:hypothetical protein n=1 Tax=Desulfosporosinus sp. OT TaxID=913865 RepID=UPI000223A1DF|nr:hypothetical protein [Desulfosporosinus sp. OT]EGW37207.1 putative lipoprotein [Desulfosporosinus sp. OT]
MYKKVIAIISSSVVACSLLVMPMVFDTKAVSAKEVGNVKFKLSEQVKYGIVKAKNFENGSKISVLHKFENKAEVIDFVALANDKLNMLSSEKNFDQSFFATTTLEKALTLKEFENFVLKYDLDIYDYKIRFVENNGTRATISAKPTNNSLIDQAIIIDAVGENTLVGVIAFTSNVNKDNLVNLINMKNDNSVYLVDVDSYFIGQSIKEQNDKDIVKVKANDIYWYLEDYKLIK